MIFEHIYLNAVTPGGTIGTVMVGISQSSVIVLHMTVMAGGYHGATARSVTSMAMRMGSTTSV